MKIETIEQLKEACIPLQLTGRDGNAFTIIGACTKAARRAGATAVLTKSMMNELTSQQSYDQLLAWVVDVFEVS